VSICIKKHINDLETIIGYTFEDSSYLLTALTHPSYRSEQKVKVSDNQRLEFLGDAVIELIVSEKLFGEFPTSSEGEMSKMRSSVTNRQPLSEMAKVLELHKYLFIGKGEKRVNGSERDSTLCDVFEAVIAAVYLDGGFENAKKTFWYAFELSKFDLQAAVQKFNPKGALQELTQSRFKLRPVYTLISQKGPEHEPVYAIEITVNNQVVGFAEGSNRKKAESNAAEMALKFYKGQLEAEK